MSNSCSGDDTNFVSVDVRDRILITSDRVARDNRQLFTECGVVAVNLMGSRGSGKTAVLEATARTFGRKARVGVLSGDLDTDKDACTIRAAGVVAQSIAAAPPCHLGAEFVHEGLNQLPWRALDYLFIENVRNPACPTVYDLGQTVNVVALSVAEGEDKPLKYPLVFRNADLVLHPHAIFLPISSATRKKRGFPSHRRRKSGGLRERLPITEEEHLASRLRCCHHKTGKPLEEEAMSRVTVLRGILGFCEHALVVALGFVLMVVGLGLGVTMIMLPVGVVIGLLGFAMFVGGLFVRFDQG